MLKHLPVHALFLLSVIGCSCSDETSNSTEAGMADGAAEASLDTGRDAVMDATSDAESDATSDAMLDAGPDAMRTDAAVATCGSFASGLSPCALAYDHTSDTIWVMGCSQSTIQAFDTAGSDKGSTPTTGGTANDVDVDIAPSAFTLGETNVAEGDLLLINGESGVAEIYQLDTEGGDPSSAFVTDFGASHVVGGAFHELRGSFYLVQDRQPAADVANRVAEIDLSTGTTLNSFALGEDFSVNYGDLDVCQSTGNLFLVSSDESTVAEFTEDGEFVTEYALPEGVSSSAGIDFDDDTGTLWVAATTGTISCLSGLFCPPI